MSKELRYKSISPTWGEANGFKLVGDRTYPIEVCVERFVEHNYILLKVIDEGSFSTEVRLGINCFKSLLKESADLIRDYRDEKPKRPTPDATDLWRENLKAWNLKQRAEIAPGSWEVRSNYKGEF